MKLVQNQPCKVLKCLMGCWFMPFLFSCATLLAFDKPTNSPLDVRSVSLLPGSPFYDRQELHRKGYLASLDTDRLLSPYRRLAKVPEPPQCAGPYGGWEQGFIRGHMVGHWLSAASRMACATGDETYSANVRKVVEGLAICQKALQQNGYLSAFPSLAFDHLEGRSKNSGGVLVPYYTYHKTLAGLLDAYKYLGDQEALLVARGMAHWVEQRLQNLTPKQLEDGFRTDRSRNPFNEFGGMSEALTSLAELTGEESWLPVAKMFNRPWLIDPLTRGEDRLQGLHANTHAAQMVGIAHHGLVTGDQQEIKAAQKFWELASGPHAFVIGGDSFKEWFDAPNIETGLCIDDQKILPPTTAESCNSQNVLALSRYLKAIHSGTQYSDFEERCLINHLLTTIDPVSGRVVYFTPLAGHFRTYLDGTFCCVGTGIENTARYNDFIYTATGTETLRIDLFVPSRVAWKQGGLTLRQTGFATLARTIKVTVDEAPGEQRTIAFRIPKWLTGPWELRYNSVQQKPPLNADGTISLRKKWSIGDCLELDLPTGLRIETSKDRQDVVSIFYGPVLLAGRLGTDNMPSDMGSKDKDLKCLPVDVPAIHHEKNDPSEWLEIVDEQKLTFRFRQVGPASGLECRPLYDLHHERYSVYWPIGTVPLRSSSASSNVQASGTIDRLELGNKISEQGHDVHQDDGRWSGVFTLVPDQALELHFKTKPWTGNRQLNLALNGYDLGVHPIPIENRLTLGIPPKALQGQQNLSVQWSVVGEGEGGEVSLIELKTRGPQAKTNPSGDQQNE